MKKIIDYEVEGCWSNKQTISRCRLCGKKLQEVPRKGHYNSKYWEFKRDDGQILVCCPEGCNVDSAEKKIKEYLKISNYCKNNSRSYNYELDYNKIQHAWINRQGKMFPVGQREHIDFCIERNTEEYTLEKQGWLKLTSKEFFWEKKLSKRQIDIIFDYIMAVGIKEDIEKLKEEIDRETGIFKIGNK